VTASESIGKSSAKPYRKAAIFLNGTYPDDHLDFYRKAFPPDSDATLLVAADGALNFFARIGRSPDVVVGDFDSVSTSVLERFPEVKKQTFPKEKDATDGELAVRYALDSGCREIEIFGAIDTGFETDQMLANLLLLMLIKDHSHARGTEIPARLSDHYQHIYLLSDETANIAGKKGNMLSIIPLSTITQITIKGTKWELEQEKLRIGSSRSLRNEFLEEMASVSVKGLAIVVHRHSK